MSIWLHAHLRESYALTRLNIIWDGMDVWDLFTTCNFTVKNSWDIQLETQTVKVQNIYNCPVIFVNRKLHLQKIPPRRRVLQIPLRFWKIFKNKIYPGTAKPRPWLTCLCKCLLNNYYCPVLSKKQVMQIRHDPFCPNGYLLCCCAVLSCSSWY